MHIGSENGGPVRFNFKITLITCKIGPKFFNPKLVKLANMLEIRVVLPSCNLQLGLKTGFGFKIKTENRLFGLILIETETETDNQNF